MPDSAVGARAASCLMQQDSRSMTRSAASVQGSTPSLGSGAVQYGCTAGISMLSARQLSAVCSS
eukprot:13707960-Alexandrium_andersonii.AAC.1